MAEKMTQEQAQPILTQAIPSYQIVKKLGEGTYGAVFLVHDKNTKNTMR